MGLMEIMQYIFAIQEYKHYAGNWNLVKGSQKIKMVHHHLLFENNAANMDTANVYSNYLSLFSPINSTLSVRYVFDSRIRNRPTGNKGGAQPSNTSIHWQPGQSRTTGNIEG